MSRQDRACCTDVWHALAGQVLVARHVACWAGCVHCVRTIDDSDGLEREDQRLPPL